MTYLLALLAVAAAAFPIDAGMTLSKLLLVCAGAGIIIARANDLVRMHWPLTTLAAYAVFLALFIAHSDYWVARIFFNLFVVLTAAAAFRVTVLNPMHFAVMLAAACGFLAFKLASQLGTDKLQVHQQLVALYVVAISARQYLPGARFAHPAILAVSLPLEIRSITLAALGRLVISPRHGAILFACSIGAVFYVVYSYAQTLGAYDRIGSLYWRLQHWESVLHDFFALSPWTGHGLGGVWRDFTHLLELEWYRQGSYVDSHNIFVQVLYDSGLIGLGGFVALLLFLYNKSGWIGRELLIMFCLFGLFQGGPWDFHLAIVFTCAWLYPAKRAAVMNTLVSRMAYLPSAARAVANA